MIYGHLTAKVQANVSTMPVSNTEYRTYLNIGDGLRHFAYQKEQRFYNGVTLEQIHGESNVNGIHGKRRFLVHGKITCLYCASMAGARYRRSRRLVGLPLLALGEQCAL